MHLQEIFKLKINYIEKKTNLRIHFGLILAVTSSRHLPYLRGIFCNEDTVS